MSKLRKSARGQTCTLQIVGVCNHNPETTVLAHVSFLDGRKGIGYKVPNLSGVFACSSCHDAIDGRSKWDREDYWYYIARGIVRTHQQMVELGVMWAA
jgi:hypothetical protein